MKLSMSMVAWYLRNYYPESHIQDDKPCILGMRIITDNVDEMQSEYLYFGKGNYFFTDQQYADAYLAVNRHSMMLFREVEFNTILNALLAAFEFFNSWENDLLDAANRNAALREFVDLASPVFENPLIVGSLDMMYRVGSNVTGHRTNPLWDETASASTAVHQAMYEPYLDLEGKRIQDLTDHPLLVRNVYKDGDPVLMMYLRQDGNASGYIAILQENADLTEQNMHLAPIFVQYCQYAEDLIHYTGGLRSDISIFKDLLQGEDVGELNLARLAKAMPEPPWRLLCIRVSERTDKLAAKALIGDMMRQPDYHVPFEQDGICYSIVAESAMGKIHPLTGAVVIGASLPFSNLLSIMVRLQQASFALRQASDKRGLYLCENYACDYLIRTLKSMEMTEALLHPALEKIEEYDRMTTGDLRKTLSAYLRMERNQLDAARELHVHPNTMRYRLQRIREVTGLTLEDPEELKYLRLSDWLE